jgi:hypothetical protein
LSAANASSASGVYLNLPDFFMSLKKGMAFSLRRAMKRPSAACHPVRR